MVVRFQKCNVQTYFTNRYLEDFMWNYPQVNAEETHWWHVNTGSDNGLVPTGNKPLPEPMLTQISRHMASLGHNELNKSTHNIPGLLVDIFVVSCWGHICGDPRALIVWVFPRSQAKLEWSSIEIHYKFYNFRCPIRGSGKILQSTLDI